MNESKISFINVKKWIYSLILIPFVIWLIINGGKFIIILDHFNLLLHEGGHGILRPFGDFIYTLGGTLMQIIIPSLFILFYYSKNITAGAQISLVWLGQNLLNISVYAGDAMTRKLPLLGGNKVYHDWTHLLNMTNLILYADEVGYFFFGLGIIIFVLALVFPLFMKEYKTVNLDLNL